MPVMLRTLSISAVTLALILGALATLANGPTTQEPAAAPQPPAAAPQNLPSMPSDPVAILEEGNKLNGLHGPDVKPWHAKLSYQIFDDGKLQTEGTYEESWISDKNYEQTYVSPDFTQTDYGTSNGLFRTGAQAWPKLQEMHVRRSLILPVPLPAALPDVKVKTKQIGSGASRLQCVIFTSEKMYLLKDSYCFDPDHPILRLEVSPDGSAQVLYNGIVEFQGRFIARNVQTTYKGKPLLRVHVDDIGALAETAFTPPPDAMSIAPDKIVIPTQTMASFIISQVAPVYPVSAKLDHISSTVILQATVAKDGAVTSLQYVSGPQDLRKSAIDAVSKWRYEPFLFLGEPIEYQGLVSIIYTLD
jgi:Gram-negative bacterial TonB protein C-terminal